MKFTKNISINNLILKFYKSDEFNFLIIGLLNTFIGYLCFFLLSIALFEVINYRLILFLAHFITVTINFYTYNTWVYKNKTNLMHKLFKFHLSYIILYPINILLFFIFFDTLQLNYFLTQAINLAVIIIFVFISNKYLVFEKK